MELIGGGALALLVLDGWDVSERGVKPLVVVPADVGDGGEFGIEAALERMPGELQLVG